MQSTHDRLTALHKQIVDLIMSDTPLWKCQAAILEVTCGVLDVVIECQLDRADMILIEEIRHEIALNITFLT